MANPFLVQRTDYVTPQSGSAITDLFGSARIRFKLPNPSPGGNALIVGIQWGDTTSTVAISDDGANTYVLDVTGTDAGNGNSIKIWHALNIAANTQVITVQFNGGASLPNHATGFVAEFGNIATSAAVDGTPVSASGSGTSVAAGGITTTQAADLILQFGIGETGQVQSYSAGTGFTFGGVDVMDANGDNHFWQWQVQALAGAINPTATASPTTAWLTGAIALKSATAGNALPAGIKVTDTQCCNDDNATGRTSPFTCRFPCPSGTNLLIAHWVGASGDLNSLSDNVNGAWTSVRASVVNGASGTEHMYMKAGATGGDLTLTLTTAAATSLGDTLVVYAVKGAAASPLDVSASTSGIQGAAGSLNIVSITPTTSNGLVIAAVGVQSQNVDPGSWTPGQWDPPDENNAWGHHYNPNTSAIQFNVTTNGGAANNWVSQAAAFKAAPTGLTFFSFPDDGEQFRAVDLTPRMLAMDDWLPLVPQPPLFEWDESQRWQLNRDFRVSLTTGEDDTGLLPIIPNIVIDNDPSRWIDVRYQQDDEPWHTFFLIPTPPPTRGWDDWDWSRDFSTVYAKPPEAEPFDFTVPVIPSFGWFDEAQQGYGQAGLSALVVLDEFVNAPAGNIVFGPAPLGRSIRFGFSISSFR